MTIANNLEMVQSQIAEAAREAGRPPEDITLVAVSKYASLEDIRHLASLGHLSFGENRIQQGRERIAALPQLDWHMIGRVQTNKVKYLTPYSLIHSLDRLELAQAMSQWGIKNNHSFSCLVQVNVAQDDAKAGIPLRQVREFLEQAALPGVVIKGLMTILAFDAPEEQTALWYQELGQAFKELQSEALPPGVTMDWLSMGMSADFPLAIKAGANLVRVGSSIFSQEEDNAL